MPEEHAQKFSDTFDVHFEKKILKLMVDDPNFLIKSRSFIKKEFFSTEILEWVYSIITAYYDSYQKIITRDAFNILINLEQQKNPETPMLTYMQLVSDVYDIKIEEKEFMLDKITEWIKRHMFVKSYKNSGILFNNHKVDSAMDLMCSSLEEIRKVTFTAPQRTFFFKDFDDRVLKRNTIIEKTDYKFSTGLWELDHALNGGLSKGELGVVVGGPKTGKSIFLVNCGGGVVKSRTGNKVLHIQLEGTAKQCEDRYEAKIMDWNYRKVVKNELPENFNKYKYFDPNSLVIRFLCDSWDYTVLDIESEIKELVAYGFTPDMIIIDYGDLLKARTKDLRQNTYLAQEEVFRDLKTLAMKWNVAIWTASQVTRAPQGKDPARDSTFVWTRQNLADSFAKVRIADLLITLNMTDDEQMQNRMRVYLDAYRDDVRGQTYNISTNYHNMQFYVPTNTSLEIRNRSFH